MTQQIYAYEGMFLISQSVAVDLQGVADYLADVIARFGGELIAMKKWDERRLAYEIDKQKRGVYILTYFKGPGDAVAQIEREMNLSERVMRVLMTRADHLTEEQMLAADGREALATEAKLRAERAKAEEDKGSGTVSLGAPPKPEAAPAEEPQAEDSDEAADDAEKPAEATAESN